MVEEIGNNNIHTGKDKMIPDPDDEPDPTGARRPDPEDEDGAGTTAVGSSWSEDLILKLPTEIPLIAPPLVINRCCSLV